jgi:hypothetical protein
MTVVNLISLKNLINLLTLVTLLTLLTLLSLLTLITLINPFNTSNLYRPNHRDNPSNRKDIPSNPYKHRTLINLTALNILML